MHRGFPHRYIVQSEATLEQQIALADYLHEHPHQTDKEFETEIRRSGGRPIGETSRAT